jgi:hypothetical protein
VNCQLRSTLLTAASGLDAFSSAEAMPVTSVKPKARNTFPPCSRHSPDDLPSASSRPP